jgi:hypothetical protein
LEQPGVRWGFSFPDINVVEELELGRPMRENQQPTMTQRNGNKASTEGKEVGPMSSGVE